MKYLIPVFVGGAAAIVAVTTALAQAHGALTGRVSLVPYLYGYAAAFVLLLIAGAMALRAAKQDKLSKAPPPPAVNVHLENIGNPVHDQSNRQTIAASLPAKEPQPHPEIELFDCKPVVIFYGGTVWREVDLNEVNLINHPPNACIAIFRKKPAPTGQVGVPAYDVTAHLTYRNEKGEQQIVNFGTWLEEYAHRVDFARGESHALVLSSTARAGRENDGQTYVLDNPHEVNPFEGRFRSGMVIYAPDERLMLRDCSEVEIALISKNVTVYAGKLRRVLESGGIVRFSADS